MSPDADLVFRALTMFGARDDEELAHELGLARKRVKVALDELTSWSAAGVAAGGRWRAAPAGTVLARLRQPTRPVRRRDIWRQHFRAMHGIDLPGPDDPTVRRLVSRAAARDRVQRLVAAERHEHLTINTEVISAAASAAALPLDRRQVERGVRVRVLQRPPTVDDHSLHHLAQLDTADPERVRELPDPPIKLLVYDRRIALFPVDPLNFEAGYVETADAVAVDQLCALFDRLWAQARRSGPGGRPAITLTPREQALVALLASGHTDASAAEELRLSLRTVAYTMRNLMDRLGVENRFQLAILLGASGTAPLPPVRRTQPAGPTEEGA
ncbi:LuxR C-terminal-related transcriptional regulator [Solwaraspora sp. WMMA2101]|uniref:helix-turn-helix transcriptional regulator n=1 Tax=Solwaraspora sp. WMMA2101 TaxID=3404124 RepID=UPI003B954879